MRRLSTLVLLISLPWAVASVLPAAGATVPASRAVVFAQNHLCRQWNDCGLGEIALIDPISTDVTVLTHDTVTEVSPKWSPSGRAIAYLRPTGHSTQIWLMNADGTNQRALTHLRQGAAGGDPWPSIDWSPDGRRIAFVAYPGLNGGATQLYVANLATGGTQLLLPVRVGVSSGVDTPAWSPDGRWIALTRLTRHGPYEILLFSPQTHHVRLLTAGMAPAWSPDSRRIAFNGDKGMIHVMDANGKHIRSLKVYGNSPTWSPDGQWIAFESTKDNENLAEIRPDGTGFHLITHLKPKWLSLEPDW